MTTLAQIMDDRDISISELAEVLDLSEKTVSAYYHGSKRPGRVTALNIARILDTDITMEDLINDKDD